MNSEDMVRLLRRVRHDYGNHLQVIMSYIDLGRYDMAKKYIVNIAERAALERNLFEQASAPVALYLYDQMLRAQELGIILEYNNIRLDAVEPLQAKNEPYQTLRELSKTLGKLPENEDYVVLYLSVYQDGESCRLIFNSKYLPETSYEKKIEG